MADSKVHGLYSMVGDDDSDTLAAGSHDSLEKTLNQSHHQSLKLSSARSRDRRRESRLVWLRWTVIVALQTAMVVLLTLQPTDSSPSAAETGGDINGLYQDLNHDYRPLKFEDEFYMPNMTSNADRMEVRDRWDKLMPRGSGSVSIPDYRDHPLLGEPIADDPLRSGPLFEASWTHALHCLYYSVDAYHQLIINGRTGEENPHHATHCFEYLRTSIMCNLDMTLEGSYSASRESGGQPHQCRDKEAAVRWIEERRVDDRQDIIGP